MFKVFGYEFSSAIKRSSFIISTCFIMVLIFLLTFVPRYTFKNQNDKSALNKNVSVKVSDLDFSDDAIYIETGVMDKRYLLTLLGMKDSQVVQSYDQLAELVKSGKAKRGFDVVSEKEFKVVVEDKRYLDDLTSDFKTAMDKFNFDVNLMRLGINPSLVEQQGNQPIRAEEVVIGKDLSRNFIFSVSYIFVLYLLILFNGSSISNTIAKEKSDRTMELLITSTRPYRLVLGKVFGNGFLGLIQFILFTLMAAIGFYLNRQYYPEGIFSFVKNLMDWQFTLVFTGFVLFGYLLYLFIFASTGAKVKRSEEINMLTLPIVALFLVIVVLTIRAMNHPNGLLMQILSFTPFSSAMAMPVRISLNEVPFTQIIISFAILVVSTVIASVLSIISYQNATRSYGSGC